MRNRSNGNAFQEKSTTSLLTTKAISVPNENSKSEETNTGDRGRETIRSHIIAILQENITEKAEDRDSVVRFMMTTLLSMFHDTEKPRNFGQDRNGTAGSDQVCGVSLSVVLILAFTFYYVA
jgi:hypothetical protein